MTNDEREQPIYILCYVREPFAYFTTIPIDQQHGDKWGVSPYEHNAGEPYCKKANDVIKVSFLGAYEAPCEGYTNSPYSVDAINKGKTPWLRTEKIGIFAGATLKEFAVFITLTGGVWTRPPPSLDDRIISTRESESLLASLGDAQGQAYRDLLEEFAIQNAEVEKQLEAIRQREPQALQRILRRVFGDPAKGRRAFAAAIREDRATGEG